MDRYLASSELIDWDSPAVRSKAAELADGAADVLAIVNACFLFVRDEIRHSWDYGLNPITCAASDVLEHRTGFCYAKSHLLAALLRANGVPTGLCYQRLTIENEEPPFSLHGLNAVHLEGIGWYRLDPRGNKPGIRAEFCPPVEKLAFRVVAPGELDLPEVWPEPLELVTNVLRRWSTYQEVAAHLPDIDLIGSAHR
ncbi:MAG: transglutaminase family protein [Chromatiales bacterium]|nr:transglutaminase family protein [Chromatiales bacterium]